jgi:hypothetical protein
MASMHIQKNLNEHGAFIKSVPFNIFDGSQCFRLKMKDT